VMEDAGVEVKVEDIAAVHRTGKAVRGHRPILVKFVSRRKKRELMKKKKSLKDVAAYKNVYINDDLTPLRARLLGTVKRLDTIKSTWTVDGKILAQPKFPEGLPEDKRPKPISIETPDDLFKLGLNEINFEELGLGHLKFSEEGEE